MVMETLAKRVNAINKARKNEYQKGYCHQTY
jgi:hypothetical protein